jgi:RNA polymerase sigma factor (sigma-70 family)
MKETELLQSLQSKKPDKALRKLYQYFPTVKSFIKKKGGNTSDAEDLFQEALVILVKNVQKPGFVLSAAVTTYLFSICKYAWKQELSKRNKVIDPTSFEIPMSSVEEDWIQHQEEEHRNTTALKALERLGSRCWDLLKGFYHEQLHMDQLASKFGFKSEKIAKNEKYKCLEKARQNYAQLQTAQS